MNEVDARSAHEALEALSGRNLLVVSITSSVIYRFAPGSNTLAEDVIHLLAVYKQNPAQVRRLAALNRAALRERP